MTDRRSEPPLASVRRQTALARAFLDELEVIAPGSNPARAQSAQAVEELTRLGCRIFEAAALLALHEEASRGPRLAKCLQTPVEAEPDGAGPPSYEYAAVEGGHG
jgi:hypothetical protein